MKRNLVRHLTTHAIAAIMGAVGGRWSKLVYALTVPGGVLLAGAVLLLNSTLLPATAQPVIAFLPYAAYAAAALLALRFHSPRVLLALVVLGVAQWGLLAHGALAPNTRAAAGFALIAVLLPVNVLALSFVRENRIVTEVSGYWLAVIGMEGVVVTLICQPETYTFGLKFGEPLVRLEWLLVPHLALALLLVTCVALAARFLKRRDPVDNAFVWMTVALAFALQAYGGNRQAEGYFALAGVLLAVGLIETSYRLAYYDQLTQLPARRAFQEATASPPPRYTLAMVDIDHFKKFNDVFGHEVGDQVLRMVAGRLAEVGGGGEPFRWGGEEFAILFRGKQLSEAAPWLEDVRQAVEESGFVVRRNQERRKATRGKDRRRTGTPRVNNGQLGQEVFVTVSIGVAENIGRNRTLDEVMRAADKALYRAKENGRNRVEMDGVKTRAARIL